MKQVIPFLFFSSYHSYASLDNEGEKDLMDINQIKSIQFNSNAFSHIVSVMHLSIDESTDIVNPFEKKDRELFALSYSHMMTNLLPPLLFFTLIHTFVFSSCFFPI